ncbi:MAG: hypothetical protein G3M70_11105 [Candidatus Nitronauta litoralis]|uniref:F5/8 type C domain-containing protein n=1 Tax=Candidatus Nitronauta litoralis TaxID=2705533 RepID=A0A7T0G110_9BACT|nr:MAG: hypothetical protein G3M70_11105 [Candidatus Nitronauta litoralis]
MSNNHDETLIDQGNQTYIFLIGIVLFAFLLLPLVPVWAASLRIVLVGICISLIAKEQNSPSPFKVLLIFTGGFTLLSVISADLYSAINSSSPASYLIRSVKSIFGHPFGTKAAFCVYLIDWFLIITIARFLWSKSDKQPRFVVTFLLLFYLFSQGRLFVEIFGVLTQSGEGDVPQNNLAAHLNGLSTWGIWVGGFLAAVFFADNTHRIKVILYTCLGAGVLQALIVDLQWLFSDFSYVLESEDFSKYFYRVRGTYYYHASSCQVLMLLFFVSLSLYAFGESKRLFMFQLLMISAIYLNTTRSISLTMIIGSIPFLLSMFLMRKKNKTVLALLTLVVLLFTSEVFVIKPVNYVTDIPAPKQSAKKNKIQTNPIKSVYATISKEGPQSEQATPSVPTAPSDTVVASGQTNPNAFSPIVVDPLSGGPAPLTEEKVASAPVDMVTANQSRSMLFLSGLPLFTKTLLLGQGVGVAKIQLYGTAFGGIENTYSTHALLPDIFIMGGGLAALMLISFVCYIIKLAAQKIISEPSSPTAWALSSLLSGLIAYLASSFFFPQERNLTILFVFIILGLIVSLSVTKTPSTKEPNPKPPRPYKPALALISSGAIIWAFATSPSFAFPSVEFCFKHHQGEQVYTNSPRIKFLVKRLCQFNDEAESTFLLKDDVGSLTNIDDSWVLWSSMQDSKYPNLREGLEYNHHRGWERMPSMTLPRNWMVVKNVQPVVSFIKVGAQKKFFNAADAGLLKWQKVSGGDTWNRKHLRTTIENNSLEKDNFIVMSFTPHLKNGISLSGFQLKTTQREAEDTAIEYELDFGEGESLKGKEHLKIYENDIAIMGIDFPTQKVFGMKFILPGSIAANTFLQLASDFYPQQRVSSNVSSVYKIFDHNHGSYFQVADFRDSRGVLVDLGPDAKRPMKLYRISGVENIHKGASPKQWKVFGSKDGKAWTLVDSRKGVKLASGLRQFDAFYIKSSEINRYYKFEFYQPEKSGAKLISELEIYLQ